ncbi:hypothetical protein J7L81_02860 [Candidatus Aerophobetes bacterium]|nr:hypothetical protein [Candidatus Aerophobetes bacterium]
MKTAIFLFVFLIFFGIVKGYYRPQHPFPEGKIYVPLFINKTFKEDIEEIITQKVVDELLLATGFRLTSEEEARFLLRGEIVKYVKEPVTDGEYKLTIGVRILFLDVEEKRTIYSGDISESLFSSASQTEKEMVERISQTIGRKILNLILKEFEKNGS